MRPVGTPPLGEGADDKLAPIEGTPSKAVELTAAQRRLHADPFPLEDEAPPEQGGVWLTLEERRIFGVIRSAIEYFELKVEPRVAGGWVRDKLLGLSSDDIDMSLDSMMGEDFARLVMDYVALMRTPDERLRTRPGTVGVIRSNPAQSKHLNTATFKLFGRSLDVNNLRTETYASDSRIPSVTIGTTRDDCLRRDFTANSMYFNILKRRVEDVSGTGVADLANRKPSPLRAPPLPLSRIRDRSLTPTPASPHSTRPPPLPCPALPCPAPSLSSLQACYTRRCRRSRPSTTTLSACFAARVSLGASTFQSPSRSTARPRTLPSTAT